MGWPPALTGAGSAASLPEGTTSGTAALGPFEAADDATLAEFQRIIYDMASLQRSADPDSFAQVTPAALTCPPPHSRLSLFVSAVKSADVPQFSMRSALLVALFVDPLR